VGYFITSTQVYNRGDAAFASNHEEQRSNASQLCDYEGQDDELDFTNAAGAGAAFLV
jgi:hypothetical protein